MIARVQKALSQNEKHDLLVVSRKREKVAKTNARARVAELLADFENQMAREYSYDDDKVWQEADKRAKQVVKEANQQIAKRCDELGIPKRYAPELGLHWYSRGENAVKGRRDELRRAAKASAEAIVIKATAEIERASLKVQEEIINRSLTSEEAKLLFAQLPSVESLMPLLNFAEFQKKLTVETDDDEDE